MVKNIATYFFNINSGVELEDCIQEGFVGLLMAQRKFDSSKGISLGAFAQRYIFGRIYRSLLGTKNLQHNKKIILLEMADNIIDTRKNYEEYTFELFDTIIAKYTDKEVEILQLVLQNYKKTEILKITKITGEIYDRLLEDFKGIC